MSQPHGTALSHYDRGRTPFFACQSDQRFSYCLFVPPDYDEAGLTVYDLVVLVHGTDRTAAEYRDHMAAFATENDCVVLAPLFPVGVSSPGELHDYKFVDYGGIRFDHVLLSMVEEVAARYRVRSDALMMHGFSGGGHFAHRFFYLHPDKLRAVSVGAPGLVTLLSSDLPWWSGTRDFEEVFGTPLDLEAMRRVPVQMVVGGEDVETWEITVSPGDDLWVEGANAAGRTRVDRIESLRRSFQAAGIDVRLDVVPGAAHNGYALLDAVRGFFGRSLSASVSKRA